MTLIKAAYTYQVVWAENSFVDNTEVSTGINKKLINLGKTEAKP
jgi:hypothetical protein